MAKKKARFDRSRSEGYQKPVSVGDRLTLTVEGLIAGGEAIARVNGFPIFVPLAFPGDVIDARVISTKGGYGRALLERVITPAPSRVKPPCDVFGTCGGCTWQALPYSEQLVWKTRLVADALSRIAGLDPATLMADCLPSPSPWGYRNKVHWAVANAGNTGDAWQIGLYEPRSHRVVETASCAIQDTETNRVLAGLRHLLAVFPLAPYDEDHHTGFLRSAFVKHGHRSGELMLGLVTRTGNFNGADAFVSAALAAIPGLTTIVQNVHGEPGNKLLGAETKVLYGPGVINEFLGGAYPRGDVGRTLRFGISARSFFQVNGSAIEVLYDQAARACGLPPEGPTGTPPRVIDAYCGTGSIALFLAARGAADVLGLEIIPEAIADAQANAEVNSLADRARFSVGAVEDLLPALARAGQTADTVVLDPPRKGCEPAVLAAVAQMAPPRVVYVSCNPATLARDLKLLADHGYTTEHVQPVDMFPQTAHVECVASLVRRGDSGR